MGRFYGIVIGRHVSVIALEAVDVPTLEHGGETFVNQSLERAPDYFTGFYDWILDGQDIVGLRYIPFGVPECMASLPTLCAAVRRIDEITLEIDLPARVPSNGTTYLDQWFGYNAVFCSASGAVVLTIGLFDDDPLVLATE